MEQVLMFATIILPVVSAALEIVKRTVTVPKNYLPLISLALGLGIGYVSYPFTDLETVLRLWAGGFAGAASTGIFEITKKRTGYTNEEVKQ